MDKYQDMNDRIHAAAEKARTDKGIKTEEEIKQDFFDVATDLFNEYIAGDVTLADGRNLTIPTI